MILDQYPNIFVKLTKNVHSLPQLINNTSENVKDKFYTHSIGGFSRYLKNILIETYIDTCNIGNCYICQHRS